MRTLSIFSLMTMLSITCIAQNQQWTKVGKLIEVIEMTKLIGMDIDDATNYMGDFSYNLFEQDKNVDGYTYLFYKLDLGDYDSKIQLFYMNNKVISLHYFTADKELRKFLNEGIKKLNLQKTKVESFEDKIISHYEGKKYKYQKMEFVNSYGNQQLELFISDKNLSR